MQIIVTDLIGKLLVWECSFRVNCILLLFKELYYQNSISNIFLDNIIKNIQLRNSHRLLTVLDCSLWVAQTHAIAYLWNDIEIN